MEPNNGLGLSVAAKSFIVKGWMLKQNPTVCRNTQLHHSEYKENKTQTAFIIAISIYCSCHTNHYKTEGLLQPDQRERGPPSELQIWRKNSAFFLFTYQSTAACLFFDFQQLTKDFTGAQSCAADSWTKGKKKSAFSRRVFFFWRSGVWTSFVHLRHRRSAHTVTDCISKEFLRFHTAEQLPRVIRVTWHHFLRNSYISSLS